MSEPPAHQQPDQWIDVGEDALEAQRKRLLRLNQMEYERVLRKNSVRRVFFRVDLAEK